MIDITSKINTLRVATAQAVVCVSQQSTVDAIVNKTVPKGDVFEMSKAAGLLGVKKTAELLPDCHPMPIEFTGIHYEINGLEICIDVTVKTIYKTGVEVEAMHGASIVALNLYDMLKPIDKGIEIRNIKLVNKKGGKSDFKDKYRKDLTGAIIVCSDTIVAGSKEDKAGKVIVSKLESIGVAIKAFEVIADEPEDIRNVLLNHVKDNIDLVIFCGGTGLSKRDVTPETIAPLLDREIPGIAEAMRNYGQQRTPYSMLSRSLAGVKGQTMVLALPGSTKGASESMDALFPPLLHAFRIFKGARHD
ncbi:bifunctional molybdenum cofactor biosynthesis protein MoaC/MoaB [Flavobacteriales bacterium]|nr:bifunctional molybdenum cofactor biosynthesis protein MoaC/MoaB [Flavobacteriales bacterium]